MAKPEWGIKHECPNCSVRFYDLLKPSPLTCPSCGYEFATDVLHRIRKSKLTKDDSDEEQDEFEDDEIEDIEDEADVSDDGFLLPDEEDDEATETSDVSGISDDSMFPDEDADIDSDEIPEELLTDDDLEENIDEEDKKSK